MNIRSVSLYPEGQTSGSVAQRTPFSPQQAPLELAGTSTRMLAYLVDTLVILTLCVVFRIFTCTLQAVGLPIEAVTITHYIGMLAILLGYHLLQEWKWQGRTVGKALLRIRVVTNNGMQPTFLQVLLRSIFRIIDVGLLGVGLLFMLMTRQEKRLGDLSAGTMVVVNPASEPAHFSVAAFLGEWGLLDLSQEDRSTRENTLLNDYASRREHLSPWGRERLQASVAPRQTVATKG
ncbi:MAG: RDD family protein [Syntrophaceae bacterium]|nr:RDD family protein [Syntrophaceae bacterium]